MGSTCHKLPKVLKIKLAHFARSGEVNLNINVVFSGSSLVTIHEEGEFPFPHVVVIRYDGSPICGGGLLTSKAVLTSSQCCERIKSVSKTKVIAGALTLSDSKDEEAEVRDVIKIGEHPSR